ncbi:MULTISPECIES: glutathione S-transferase family protein [Streptomyces]|uniref:glutathione S-transferase family protein n=1 Tax=Streptomyces lycopersici TaxID=2974589 RepID=UPI0021D3B120|nr:glutathione S-transferase family protein [Streptomyces sp. NEAU-383]
MKLYWSPRSPFVRKVMVFAHEVGVLDRLELVRTPVALTSPNLEHIRTRNPLGRIPTLETDEGLLLPESVVICEYLDSLHDGEPLFPPVAERRWPALRRHALGSGLTEVLILWRNERGREEQRRLAAMLDACRTKTLATLDVLDREARELERTPFDIGHVAVGCALGYLDYRFTDLDWREGRPELARWFETFRSRPSARATEPYDG